MIGAGLDTAVGDVEHRAHASDEADAGDDAAAGDVGVAVVVIGLVAGQRRQFDEGRAAVQQQFQPFARQQLVAGGEARAALLRIGPHPRFQAAEFLDQGQHGAAVRLEGLRARIDGGFQNRHGA